MKTAANALKAEQLKAYLDVAKDNGFDALITITNEIPPNPGTHPTTVDKRRLQKVALHHWSWTQVLTEAIRRSTAASPTRTRRGSSAS